MDLHVTMGKQEEKLDNHADQIESLWRETKENAKELVKVRIKLATLTTIGGLTLVIGQAVSTALIIKYFGH